jgi:hypothetical protein
MRERAHRPWPKRQGVHPAFFADRAPRGGRRILAEAGEALALDGSTLISKMKRFAPPRKRSRGGLPDYPGPIGAGRDPGRVQGPEPPSREGVMARAIPDGPSSVWRRRSWMRGKSRRAPQGSRSESPGCADGEASLARKDPLSLFAGIPVGGSVTETLVKARSAARPWPPRNTKSRTRGIAQDRRSFLGPHEASRRGG